MVPGFKFDFKVCLYRTLVYRLPNTEILKEAEKLQIKRVYSYLEALSIILKAIMQGEVDQQGVGVFVYFCIIVSPIYPQKIDLYRLCAYRDSSGELSVHIDEELCKSACGSGDYTCF